MRLQSRLLPLDGPSAASIALRKISEADNQQYKLYFAELSSYELFRLKPELF